MISISDNQQTAYTSDNRKFGLFVNFPAFEEYNLANSDIVEDSLKFTEDIMPDGFKLGGCNASSIEFDFTKDSVIGNTDLYGKQIEPYHIYYTGKDCSLKSIPGDITTTGDMVNPIVGNKALINFDWHNYFDYDVTAIVRYAVGQGDDLDWVTCWSSTVKSDAYAPIRALVDLSSNNRYILLARSDVADTTIDISERVVQVDVLPLGVFYVDSCPVKSDSPTRTLTAYDILYSEELDADVSFAEGSNVTVSAMLDKAEEITGFDFKTAKTSKELSWTQEDTEDDPENYTIKFDNGVEIGISTKTTEVTVPDATLDIEHTIDWVDPLKQQVGYRWIFSQLSDFLGLSVMKTIYPDEYESSEIATLETNLNSIFRKDPSIGSDKTFTITRFNGAYGSGKRFVYNTEEKNIAAEPYTVKDEGNIEYQIQYKSIENPQLLFTKTLPIFGQSITVQVKAGDVSFEPINCQQPATMSHQLYFDTQDFIDTYLMTFRDMLVNGGLAEKEDVEEGDTDDWQNIVFFNDTDYKQRDAYYELGGDIEDALNLAMTPNFNHNQCKYIYKDRYTGELEEKGDSFITGYNKESYLAGPLRCRTSYDGSVTFLNFPTVAIWINLGTFQDTGDYIISFDDVIDESSAYHYWTPNNEILAIKEWSSGDTLTDLTFVADSAITLTPREIVKAYAELNGKIFKVNRYGTAELISLQAGKLAHYPETDIYPSTDLYPEGSAVNNEIYEASEIESLTNYSLDNPIKYTGIRMETSDGYGDVIGSSSGDIYDLSNSITTTFPINDTLKASLPQTVLDAVADLQFTSFDADVIAKPYVETGDGIAFETPNANAEGTMISRTMKGINIISDSISQELD